RLLVVAIIEQAVAIVDHRQFLEQIGREGILRIIVEYGRRPTDRLGTETSPRPVGNGGTEGDAPNHGSCPGDLLGKAAPHEGKRPGIGGVRRGSEARAAQKGVVDRLRRHPALPFRRKSFWAGYRSNEKSGPRGPLFSLFGSAKPSASRT